MLWRTFLCKSCQGLVYCASHMNFYYNAGPPFINLPHREQDHPSDYARFKESSWSGKEPSICEANFRFPPTAPTFPVFRYQLWCSCTGRVCADTVSSTRRLSAPNRVLGQCLLRLMACRFGDCCIPIILLDDFKTWWCCIQLGTVCNAFGHHAGHPKHCSYKF